MANLNERIETFHQLHAAGCFVIPNPWDLGSATLLVQLGFKALATTSSGFAWSTGRRDKAVPLDDVLHHLRQVAAAVDVPVSADFEGGFALEADGVAANVARAAGTGIAGLSIEDSSGDPSAPLIGFDLAVDRIRAARQAIDASGSRLVLTGRSEGFVAGRPDLHETIRRLIAYAEAGADCLHAPGLREMTDIEAVVKAVAPRPVNVLAGSPFTTLATLSAAGVRRVSVGGALARVALTALLDAAGEIARDGTFTALGRALPGQDINSRFSPS
jgi:methylisocitrate lyase